MRTQNPKGEGRDLDKLEKASERFAKSLAAYMDKQGLRYRIDYGLWDEGNVKVDDHHTRLGARWNFEMHFEGYFQDNDKAHEDVDKLFKKSGLNKLLFYDGWESCSMEKGKCIASDLPEEWRTWFWYEKKNPKVERPNRVEGKREIHTYAYRPRRGSKGVSLKPRSYMRDIERELKKNPSEHDLVKRLKF